VEAEEKDFELKTSPSYTGGSQFKTSLDKKLVRHPSQSAAEHGDTDLSSQLHEKCKCTGSVNKGMTVQTGQGINMRPYLKNNY
jgi:hypothetical protein